MKIDPNKKYKTRDGKPVTHLHRAPEGWPNSFPWRGIIGENHAVNWNDEGMVYTNEKSHSDLIEDRKPLEVQIVIDREGKAFGFANTNKEWYDNYKPDLAPFRVATFREVLP